MISIGEDLGNLAACGMAVGVGDFQSGNIDLFSNYPEEWQSLYFSKGLMKQDPIVHAGLTQLGCNAWPALNQRNQVFMGAAHDHGLRDGIVVSNLIGGSRCIAGIATSSEANATERQTALAALRGLHLDYLTERATSLSTSQKELVYMFANGLRGKEIAALYGVSEQAIKQRKLHIQKHIGVNNFLVVVNVCARAGITFHLTS